MKGHTGAVCSLVLGANSRLYSGSSDNTIRVCSLSGELFSQPLTFERVYNLSKSVDSRDESSNYVGNLHVNLLTYAIYIYISKTVGLLGTQLSVMLTQSGVRTIV